MPPALTLMELLFSSLLAIWVLVEWSMFLLNLRNGSLLKIGFFSALAVLSGLYLVMRYGLVLDYGSSIEVMESWAFEKYSVGNLLLTVGFSPLLLWLVWSVMQKLYKRI